MWYVQWDGPYSNVNVDDVRSAHALGAIPVITWMSQDPADPDAVGYNDANIAAGSQDPYIEHWAATLHNAGPVLLRLDPEMNGSWEPWSIGQNGNTGATFIAAWRHIHTIFTAAGDSNVLWVWSPNVNVPGSTPLGAGYPGNAYVNVLALDGYNWGTVDDHQWQSPTQVFAASLAQLSALGSQPVLLAEVGCAPTGGDKAAWITAFFALLEHQPRIEGFIWFDADKETDWRFESAAAGLAAFRLGLAD